MSYALFAFALGVAAVLPGPAIAALVSRVITSGWRDILPFLIGLWIAELIWLWVVLGGLSVIAQNFQLLFQIIRWAGIAWLCWLAYSMWRQPVASGEGELPRAGNPLSMFLTGLAVNLGNPKAMAFFVALLPSILDLTMVSLFDWAALSVITLLVLAISDGGWVLMAVQARRILRTPRAVRFANRLGAVAMGGAAAALASKSQN